MGYYLVLVIFILIISFKILGLYQVSTGRLSSVSLYFLPFDSLSMTTFNDLSEEQKGKIKKLLFVATFISILLSVLILILFSRTSTEILLLLALSMYLNDTIFTKVITQKTVTE